MHDMSYFEGLWQKLPQPLAPARAALRERFLLERHRAIAAELGRPPRALDLGCGEGHFAALLSRQGAEVVGVEVAPEAVRRAQTAHPGLDVRLVAPAMPLPFEDSRFDLVWAGEVIEHVADTASWLSEVRRVLRSGGMLALSTPDHGPLSIMAMALWPRRFDAGFDPRSDHLRFYTRRSLACLLADFGFDEVVAWGAGGVPGARKALLAWGRRRRF
jgi:2-polyprenyl-6-hydroxyphenyl methylase/3-demethylubiquinone-9 3-methyltransferase